jgi:glutamine---fructose-6-phosphate transaminase (isomerizing)
MNSKTQQPGIITFHEIMNQPVAWRAALSDYATQRSDLSVLIRRAKRSNVILTGCGTTYALGLSAAFNFRQYGIPAIAIPASEITLYPELVAEESGLLLAVSRSGMTSETLWAVDAFRKRCPKGLVVAITTKIKSNLASQADYILDATAVRENSVVETLSFTGMLLLVQALAGDMGGDISCYARLENLPDKLDSLMPGFMQLAQEIAENQEISRFFLLGNGPLYGIAYEAMFKVKEFFGGWAEAYHPLEFRHGPRMAVNSESLVVGFFSDHNEDAEIRLLDEMKEQGALTFAVLERRKSLALEKLDYVVELTSDLNERERPAIYLPLLQLISYYRAIKNSLDPDHPAYLKAVTQL